VESLFRSQNEYSQGDECELIAISKACAAIKFNGYPNLFREMGSFSELKKEETYFFHNILWIEWKDGIAYRKVLGRVMTAAWERQNMDEIDVLLG
jgi:hypothetical protein